MKLNVFKEIIQMLQNNKVTFSTWLYRKNNAMIGGGGRISEVWGLGTDICLWKGGLVNWKFPNLGACELKISKFGDLWAKTWVKIEAVEAKIPQFSQKGVLWTDSFAWNGTLANYRKGVKRGSSGPHILAHCFHYSTVYGVIMRYILEVGMI